jgi:hypothetical protein
MYGRLGRFGWLTEWPPRRFVGLGALNRTEPISRSFGFDRGTPVDRYYIEEFLASRTDDIRGRVLEIGDAVYTRRFGGGRVEKSDVLHATLGNPAATVVGDLATGEGLADSAYDCAVLTQTLQFVYDVRAAVRTVFDALAPGGVALLTGPGISQISRYDADRWGDYWRFTSASLRRLLEESFPSTHVHVEARGNVLAAVALLHGLAVEDLPRDALDQDDRDYEVLLTARAAKPDA